jgi:hypothetical protein
MKTKNTNTRLTFLLCAVLLLIGGSHINAGDVEIKIINPGFEEGLNAWNVVKADKGKSSLSREAAHSGEAGVEVNDDDTEGGSEVFSELIPIKPDTGYQVRFWAKLASGTGIGVYLLFYDAEQKLIALPRSQPFSVPDDTDTWKQYVHEAIAPADAAFVAIRLHSYAASVVRAYVDDFEMVQVR